jgi:membrane-associated phospholipid phosphatase
MFIDEPVYKLMLRNQNRTWNSMERVGNFLGQPENNYPIMLFVWASGVIVNNDWLRDTGIMIVASVTSSGIIQSISKEAVGRSRPIFGRGAFDFKPFGGADYHSFPSGHTMLSVATSWVLARQVNFLPLKIGFYALPIITGASRIYVGAHWLSDILLGSALGIACAESILRLYPLIKQRKNISMNMTANGNGMGIAVYF